jgi:RND family efflux transporter MFP subunit
VAEKKRLRLPHIGRTTVTIGACLGIILLTGATVMLIRTTEPEAEQSGALRRSAALVETVELSRGTYRPELVVLGTVEAARDITLSPRVEGEIIAIDKAFVPGGYVRKGERLLTIDPADFSNDVAMRESDLREARASLAVEQGRRTVAEKEFALLEEEIDPGNRALVLREPQIESARARVEAARASLEQARLNLERTRIVAPFDAQILTRSVNLGSQVAPGDALARLVGTDEYWVIASVPLSRLQLVEFPANAGRGSPVRVRNRGAWEPGVFRTGRVDQLIGTVDRETRLARVLITVSDPMARDTDAPPLILGTVLETRIEGRALENVIRLSRDYLRENDTVWVKEDGRLSVRSVDIAYTDARYAYIRDGLEAGEEVVTTNLATAAAGMPLRDIDAGEENARAGTATGGDG